MDRKKRARARGRTRTTPIIETHAHIIHVSIRIIQKTDIDIIVLRVQFPIFCI